MSARGTRFAVIFDMDGVLTDSEPAFHAAVNDILGRYGKSHRASTTIAQFIGIGDAGDVGGDDRAFELPATLDEILEAYEPPLMERLPRATSRRARARELVSELRARGVPVALCTASYRRWVDAILPSAGLGGLFDVISTADVVERDEARPGAVRAGGAPLGFEAAGVRRRRGQRERPDVRAAFGRLRRPAARDGDGRVADARRRGGHRAAGRLPDATRRGRVTESRDTALRTGRMEIRNLHDSRHRGTGDTAIERNAP